MWEYSFWSRSFKGVWLIFFCGYFPFYVGALVVIGMKSIRDQIITVGTIYLIAIAANIIGLGLLGWKY